MFCHILSSREIARASSAGSIFGKLNGTAKRIRDTAVVADEKDEVGDGGEMDSSRCWVFCLPEEKLSLLSASGSAVVEASLFSLGAMQHLEKSLNMLAMTELE